MIDRSYRFRLKAETQATVWSPSDLPGIQFWLDPSPTYCFGAGPTLVTPDEDGDVVETVQSRHDITKTYVQATPSKQMGLYTDAGGRIVLRSNSGGVRGYTTSAVDLTDAATIVLAVAVTSASRVLNSNTINALIAPRRGSLEMYIEGGLTNNLGIANASPHVLIARKPTGSGNWTMEVDGVSVSLTANSAAWRVLGIGSGGSGGASETFIGDIYTMIACTSQLTGTDLSQVRTYAGTRCGLTL